MLKRPVAITVPEWSTVKSETVKCRPYSYKDITGTGIRRGIISQVQKAKCCYTGLCRQNKVINLIPQNKVLLKKPVVPQLV
jgi:hypothetical protein